MFSCKFCQIFKSTVPDDCFCSQHQSFIEKYDLIKHPSQIWFFYLLSRIILERIYYLVFEINNLMTVHVLGLKGRRYCKLNFEYYQILILLSWNQILYLFENKNYKFTTFEINLGLSFFFFFTLFPISFYSDLAYHTGMLFMVFWNQARPLQFHSCCHPMLNYHNYARIKQEITMRHKFVVIKNTSWYNLFHSTKKWNFPLRIFVVYVNKSVVFCGFDHIYYRNP